MARSGRGKKEAGIISRTPIVDVYVWGSLFLQIMGVGRRTDLAGLGLTLPGRSKFRADFLCAVLGIHIRISI